MGQFLVFDTAACLEIAIDFSILTQILQKSNNLLIVIFVASGDSLIELSKITGMPDMRDRVASLWAELTILSATNKQIMIYGHLETDHYDFDIVKIARQEILDPSNLPAICMASVLRGNGLSAVIKTPFPGDYKFLPKDWIELLIP